MNTYPLLLGSGVLLLPTCFCLAQGTFPPTSAPSVPIMKTLTQVEPRTPIAAAPFTISQAGSYYLTGNLTVVDLLRLRGHGKRGKSPTTPYEHHESTSRPRETQAPALR